MLQKPFKSIHVSTLTTWTRIKWRTGWHTTNSNIKLLSVGQHKSSSLASSGLWELGEGEAPLACHTMNCWIRSQALCCLASVLHYMQQYAALFVPSITCFFLKVLLSCILCISSSSRCCCFFVLFFSFPKVRKIIKGQNNFIAVDIILISWLIF